MKSFESFHHLSRTFYTVVLCLFFLLSSSLSFSQLTTYDNFSGNWNSASSWVNWSTPDTNDLDQNIEIYGTITRNGDLNFHSGSLLVRDTLIINGKMTIDSLCDITIMPGGIIIIYGDAEIDSLTNIYVMSGSYFIVDSSLVYTQGLSGSFNANDNPPNIFLNNVMPAGVSNNDSNYPALNCTLPPYSHSNSGCAYGNMVDLSIDPIYSLYLYYKYDPPAIISHPSDTTICFINSVSMYVSVTNANIYRWQLNEGAGFQNIDNLIDYSGFDSEILIISNPMISYNGYLYRCLIVGLNGDTIYTDVARLNIFQQPIANPGLGGVSCDNTFNLGATLSSDIGFWKSTGGSGTVSFIPDSSVANAVVAVTDYGTYEFTWTETNNDICTDDSTISVTFYEQPVANPGPGDIVCGDTYGFAAVLSSGTGVWSLVNGVSTVSLSDNSVPNTTVTVDDFGLYDFMWTETNAACADNSTISIEFFEQPVANAGVGGVACGNTFNLNAIPSTVTGVWDISSGPGTASFVPDRSAVDAVVTVTDYGTYEFVWTVTNGTCTDKSYVSVIFYEMPEINMLDNAETCGLEYELSVSTDRDGIWSLLSGPANANFNGQERNRNVLVNVDIPGTYVFTWTGHNDVCSNSSVVDVIFHKTPLAMAGDDQQLLDKTETRMQAVLEIGETGEWQVVLGSAYIQNIHSSNTSVSDLQNGENILRWVVNNGLCRDSAEVSFFVEAYIPPTIITPNGDDKNDYFIVEEINDFGSIRLAVFNGKGKEVYYSSDYKNEWNGIDKNGNKLPDGTYYYIIDFGNQKVKKSYVLIRR